MKKKKEIGNWFLQKKKKGGGGEDGGEDGWEGAEAERVVGMENNGF
jgi:hypothetical protein